MLGSSTGATTFTSANAGGSNFTLTFPARTANVATSSGTLTNGNCVSIDASGNFVDAGGACTTGGGGGTVNAGTATQLAYYASSTNAVSGAASATISTGALSLGASGTVGSVTLGNGTSGTGKIHYPATGAMGTSDTTVPIGTTTMASLEGVETFSGAKTFGETHGTTYAPTLTSNNYNAATTDCGKVLLIPTGTTPTVTMPNVNAACTIVLVQASATQFTVQAASGGTIHSVNSYTKSKAQYAVLFLTIIVPSASVAEWTLGGDGA
jgi:hypothetical protein